VEKWRREHLHDTPPYPFMPSPTSANSSDAVESITCGYLSGVVLLGLIAQLFMPGWWWVDSVTSLAIVVLLVKEGREAWEGEESETE
jgi:hypothetical protein